MNKETIFNVKKILNNTLAVKPIFGICLGHQMLATAAGCKTYKMKYVIFYLLVLFFFVGSFFLNNYFVGLETEDKISLVYLDCPESVT